MQAMLYHLWLFITLVRLEWCLQRYEKFELSSTLTKFLHLCIYGKLPQNFDYKLTGWPNILTPRRCFNAKIIIMTNNSKKCAMVQKISTPVSVKILAVASFPKMRNRLIVSNRQKPRLNGFFKRQIDKSYFSN